MAHFPYLKWNRHLPCLENWLFVPTQRILAIFNQSIRLRNPAVLMQTRGWVAIRGEKKPADRVVQKKGEGFLIVRAYMCMNVNNQVQVSVSMWPRVSTGACLFMERYGIPCVRLCICTAAIVQQRLCSAWLHGLCVCTIHCTAHVRCAFLKDNG